MAANTQSYTPPQTASTPTRHAPRPTLARVIAFPAWTLCIECGADYDPTDIPAELADIGRYHTCADCRTAAVADMAAHAVGGWS